MPSRLRRKIAESLVALCFAVAASCAAGGGGAGDGDSESHFLKVCTKAEDCDKLTCVRGACTLPCGMDPTVCDEFENAECVALNGSLESEEQACDLRCKSDGNCARLDGDFMCLAGWCRERTACSDSDEPPEPWQPEETWSKEVDDLLATMSLEEKVQQMYGLPDPPEHTNDAYRDIQRGQDVPIDTGKTIRGYRYRNGGRGVNLAAEQHDRSVEEEEKKSYSTVFPAQSVRGASWDVELEHQIGVALGDETMASKNTIMLAPCMNLLRHPYWGRSQESYGEDVFHTGAMATALTRGIQEHVPACAKHFAAYNIESERDGQNAQMTEQALREIYTRHFERVVREGEVACVMAAHNLINGVKSTQNAHLLRDILKGRIDEGGMEFQGFVVSNWWAMPGAQEKPNPAMAQDRAAEALDAGLDVELPWALNFSQLGALVESGRITPERIDDSARRVLTQKVRFGHLYTDDPYGRGTPKTSLDGDSIVGNDEHIALAEESAVRSMVLLDNGPPDEPVLPIPDVTSIAVVGAVLPVTVTKDTDLQATSAGDPVDTDMGWSTTVHLAKDVNTGDRGSSRTNHDPAQSASPFDGIRFVAARHGIRDVTVPDTVADAANADFIVVVVGLTAGDEGEMFSLANGGDRSSLDLPMEQNQLVSDVLDLGKPTAIIIESGSVVNVPWRNHPNRRQATIWAGYPGQRGGLALGKLLFGDRNFSGKLPISWPKESELPPFPARAATTDMGYFFGYREYDRRVAAGQAVDLEFPFGHGLSYTTFEYSELEVPCNDAARNSEIQVSVDVTNTGSVPGDEIVMLFVQPPPKPRGITGERPVKELKGFARVNVPEGETQRVTIPLRIRDLRRWEAGSTNAWIIDPGTYTVYVGPSGDTSRALKGYFTIPE